jgi:Cu(I)/Ag(I) efflux system membrane fusion protein
VQNLLDGVHKNDKTLLDLANQQLTKLDNGESIAAALRKLLDGKRTIDDDLVQQGRLQLVKLGMHEDQVDDIIESGKAIRHLVIRSPIKGHVLKKYVKEGQYVDEGSPLYDIVDLNSVWIQAQVYEEDMAFLPTFHHPLRKDEESSKALPVTATTRGAPNEAFTGRLSFVYPHVDQDTRTVVARFEVDNPGHKLRPGTSANVKFKIPPERLDALARAQLWNAAMPTGDIAAYVRGAVNLALLDIGRVLAVPDGAVIDTGRQKIVYRQISPGAYEGVQVELGPRMTGPGDVAYYPVLHGLDVGDVVVAAGSFLVDAETRLNPAAGSIYFGGSGSKTGASNVRPSTPMSDK